jgi:hypothetical protein
MSKLIYSQDTFQTSTKILVITKKIVNYINNIGEKNTVDKNI